MARIDDFRILQLPLFATAVFALGGCTTQLVVSRPEDDLKTPVVGHVYSLPRVDHQLTVDRELTKCTYDFESADQAILAWLKDFSDSASGQKPAATRAEINVALLKVLKDLDAQSSDVEALLPPEIGVKRPRANAAYWNDTNLDEFFYRLRDFNAKPVVQLTVELRASATAIVSADVNHTYVIDYRKTQAPTKTTDLVFENYENGTLKSVNVTVDDQTGAVIQSALSGIAKIAAATGGFPLPVNAKGKSLLSGFPDFKKWSDGKKAALSGANPCATLVQTKLAQRAALNDVVESSTKTISEKSAELDKSRDALAEATTKRDKQKAVVDAIKDGVPEKEKAKTELAKLDNVVKSNQTSVSDKEKQLTTLQETSAGAEKKFSAVRKVLTKTTSTILQWERGGGHNTAIEGTDGAITAWIDKDRIAELCAKSPNECAAQLSDIKRKLNVTAAIYPQTSRYDKIAWSSSQADLVYRQPLQTILFVCKNGDCVDGAGKLAALPENKLLESAVSIPQLGLMATLPLVNGPFENNSIIASFSESGALTKSAYKSNASAVKAAAVFEQSADTFLKFKDAKRSQETEKIKQHKSEVDAQTELLKSQIALEKAKLDLKKQTDGSSNGASE